jgi:hypothetical protein
MKQENNIEQLFNIEPLLNDLNKVIENGLNNLLKNYIDNYKLYEETHNCIMNLPSVKREIAKKSELNNIYNDLPDLISISSETDSSEIEFSCYNNYNRIPTQDESDEESEDTLLCMRKVVNKLLKEKEEAISLYQEGEKTYKEKYDKEIVDLKDRINVLLEDNNKNYTLFIKQKEFYDNIITEYSKVIDNLKNQLNSCVEKPLVCDLTSDNDELNQSEEVIDELDQKVIEVKEEKENIILHIEETSEAEAGEDEVNEEDEESESEADEEEDEEAAEDEVAIEDEEEDEASEAEEEEVDEDEASEAEEEEVDEDEASEAEEEEVELVEDEEIETEKSDSDVESQEEKEEKEEIVEDEEELIEIEIDGVTYCTENDDNGFIYELDNDGNVGETVGYLKDGEPFFN